MYARHILAVMADAAGPAGVEEEGAGPGAEDDDKNDVAQEQDDGTADDVSPEQVGACLLWISCMCKR